MCRLCSTRKQQKSKKLARKAVSITLSGPSPTQTDNGVSVENKKAPAAVNRADQTREPILEYWDKKSLLGRVFQEKVVCCRTATNLTPLQAFLYFSCQSITLLRLFVFGFFVFWFFFGVKNYEGSTLSLRYSTMTWLNLNIREISANYNWIGTTETPLQLLLQMENQRIKRKKSGNPLLTLLP